MWGVENWCILGHVLHLAWCEIVLKYIALMNVVLHICGICGISCQKDISIGQTIVTVGIVGIIWRIEGLIFMKISGLDSLVESAVSVGLKNVFGGVGVDASRLHVELQCWVVGIERMWTDITLVEFVVPGIGEIGPVGSVLLWIFLKHSLSVILHNWTGLDLIVTGNTGNTTQTDITGIKWPVISSVSITVVSNTYQVMFHHRQRMPIESSLSLLPHILFIVLNPLLFVVTLCWV